MTEFTRQPRPRASTRVEERRQRRASRRGRAQPWPLDARRGSFPRRSLAPRRGRAPSPARRSPRSGARRRPQSARAGLRPSTPAIQPASPSSMLAHIAVIGRDCRGILDLPLAVRAHQDQREHPQGRLGARLNGAWPFRSPRRGTMSDTDRQPLYSSVRLAPRPHKLRLPSHRQLSSTSYLPITVQRCMSMVRDTPPLSWTIQRFILQAVPSSV